MAGHVTNCFCQRLNITTTTTEAASASEAPEITIKKDAIDRRLKNENKNFQRHFNDKLKCHFVEKGDLKGKKNVVG